MNPTVPVSTLNPFQVPLIANLSPLFLLIKYPSKTISIFHNYTPVTMAQNVLIIGATRGLGASLANLYAAKPSTTVYGTTRQPEAPTGLHEKIVWVKNVDVAQEGVGKQLVNQLGLLGGGGGMVAGGVVKFDIVVCVCP